MEWYILLAIIVGTLILLVLLLMFWYFSYINPSPTGKITDNISVIRTGIVNSYVYSKGSEKILIDAGTYAKKLEEGLAELSVDLNSISHVFLTHSDSDHIGGITLFSHANINFGEKSKIKNYEKYNFLDDGEIIDIQGIKVQAIATPGHRLGHTAYLIDDEFLFTGDVLRIKNGEIKPFLRIISSDYEKQIESIRKLSQLKNISILFTAHNGFTTNFEKAIENWKD